MIDLLLFAWFFVFLSAVGGVLLAFVCFLDWLYGLLKVRLQNHREKEVY